MRERLDLAAAADPGSVRDPKRSGRSELKYTFFHMSDSVESVQIEENPLAHVHVTDPASHEAVKFKVHIESLVDAHPIRQQQLQPILDKLVTFE